MILLILIILFDAAANGILDSIDHHKGARTLNDFWHVMKYVDRALLIGVGAALYATPFVWWYGFILFACLILFKKVWNYVYYEHFPLWVRIDDTWKVSTGIDWLDEFLGLDK
jgi:hypothetical protein